MNMKAMWLDEVTALVGSEEFADWFKRLELARQNNRLAKEKHEELLTQTNLLEFRAELAYRRAIDTLEEANRLADLCAELANESAELENASFEVVSQYELQRERCTKKWEQIGGFEVRADQGDKGAASKLTKLRAEYEEQGQEKQRLWSEVERLWINSIHCNLSLSERQIKASFVRDEAESLFLVHEEERQLALEQKAKAHRMAVERDTAQHELEAVNIEASTLFNSLVSDTFLFWISREDNKFVYAVSLIYNSESYAMPVGPGQVFRCSALKGIDELELLQTESTFGSLLAPPKVGAVSKKNKKALQAESESESSAEPEKPSKKKRKARKVSKKSGAARKKKTGTRKLSKSTVAAEVDKSADGEAEESKAATTKSGKKKRARKSKRKKKATAVKPEPAETMPPKESDEDILVSSSSGDEKQAEPPAAEQPEEANLPASSDGDSEAAAENDTGSEKSPV